MTVFMYRSKLCILKNRMSGMSSAIGASTVASYHHKVMVVGLGNPCLPGTRHSVGMAAVEKLASVLQAPWSRERRLDSKVAHAVKTDSEGNSVEVVLVKPLLPMNFNGKCVLKAVRKFEIPEEQLLMVHDDMDTAVGKYKVKARGSATGHNGVKSVMASLRRDDILRLKIGIGRPPSKLEVVDYVLAKFDPTDAQIIVDNMDNVLRLGVQQLAEKAEFDAAILGEMFDSRARKSSSRQRRRTVSRADEAGGAACACTSCSDMSLPTNHGT